ncbi:MAG: sigma-70 family RNA polymerase sigma factor [Chitinophagales bacterium]|nr:sigma-70 family RNA polymerase sigma factor [Chitinophagales bacterium]
MEEKARILAAQKDPQEFRYFYDTYFKNIFLFVYRRTDDEAAAADITQQVFLKALQNMNKFEFRGAPFSSWLYRIAGNEVMQYFRDAKKVRVVCIDNSGLHEMLADEDESFDIERREHVFAAIKKLSPEDLELIEMRYFEKRSFGEIAEIKNITANNAKVKVHRILDKVKRSLTVEA